ncbi:MAG: DEAD/DEAH box helicase [Candidatus Omnitrophica bacterium]|nr:DEAD/DEAH box helicase [Candidatus Omnitrophota bacterium]MCM8826680.1 DEAD/DEAH box helicase [Candidatus Omnitrophota bacterium]
MNNIILDEFQKTSIEFAKEGYSIIVSAPTGTGKTLIAEYIINDCIKKNRGVVYTAPIKALSNQKFRDFSAKYPNNVGILTGDVSINPFAPILIMTTEIFRNAILTDTQRFNNREWAIFDEIHYLDDIERGTVWEETIILLPTHMRILALSATIPNIDDFVKWLSSVHSFPLKKIIEKKRPVPLNFYFQCNNTFFESFKALKNSQTIPTKLSQKNTNYLTIKPNKLFTLIEHLKENDALPCIYFSFSRKRCVDLADEIYSFNFLNPNEQKKITEIFSSLVEKFNIGNDPEVNFLYPLIKRGIAYHHAGLLPTLKEIIERLFTTGLLKFIFTTETFALGINMPARTVVFDSLHKYYGLYHRYLKTRDFYQMAGRAGRRGIDKQGFVYLRINPYRIDLETLEKIIFGKYEPIISQLRSCYATILNLYKIMGEKLYQIYPRSFHFYQANEYEKKEALNLLKRKVSLLKYTNYINDNQITLKAELASYVYSFELQIGELYQIGFLEKLNEVELFTMICSLVYEPRKAEPSTYLSKKTKKLRNETKSLIKLIHSWERKFRIYPLSKDFYFHLAEAARAWYEGEDFYKLNKFCHTDSGEIVRYFRMAIQVLREIFSSAILNDDFKNKIRICLGKINRDVVDAEKQLRQEL